ncbi:MAG: amidophosphoribosyltransferase [Caldisphaeraceae archaeon]|nr:amidophosphoribosyltransferase [Caldisphaeraceae archaeon]
MCGISAWFGENASEMVYSILLEIQHRGHDAAGISFAKGGRLEVFGGSGFLWNAIDPLELDRSATLAIGHVRYSTSWSYAGAYQPVAGSGKKVAIAFNGNIVNFREASRKVIGRRGYAWDAKAFADILEKLYEEYGNLADAMKEASTVVEGSYSLVAISSKGEILVARDPRGMRPLAYSLDEKHLGVSSETAALSALGLGWRELERGSMIYCQQLGSCSKETLGSSYEPAPCAFEYIYFLRPDSFFEGVNAHEARKRMGAKLAEKDGVEADLVAPVPDSGRSAAIGYAIRRNLPFDEVIYRNRFSGRAFISPPSLRREVLLKKFQAMRESINNRKVVLVDDSIVRGDTSRHLVRLLKSAGAKEVHLRSAAPPIVSPCFFGIDMPTREELVASSRRVEDVRRYVGADTIIYNTVDDIKEAIGRPVGISLCLACFTSTYPIKVDIEALGTLFSRGRR